MASAEQKDVKDKAALHPPWFKPAEHAAKPLMLLNSLTSTKVPFISNKPNQIDWYVCGPTVYDSAHLGHARAYITFDILRRVMSDYFGYSVFYQMNITDIDDKIILRARRNYLFAQYVQKAVSVDEVVKDVRAAFAASLAKLETQIKGMNEKIDAAAKKEKKEELKKDLKEVELKHENLTKEKAAFEEGVSSKDVKDVKESKDDSKASLKSRIELLAGLGKSVLSEALDKVNGAGVTQQDIFQQHARYYETEFLEDMAALNIREPDVLTRVSEYVPNIVAFIQEIIKRGFAYASSTGSVYFNVEAFSKQQPYAKLAPWHLDNEKLQAEGEGDLSSGGSDKKNASDFALWKASKPGEPFWPSPWGNGRPGWHIECSAMASDLLGNNFDIHGGGEDLMFPHHDNELAQSEAHCGCKQWVNYFLHAGHLNIKGLKMSKSLKNFITIREVLKTHSARQIRILFLLQSWEGKMNFGDNSLTEAITRDSQLREFFLNTKAAIRARGTPGSIDQMWDAADRTHHNRLVATQTAVHNALLDNINYPVAMGALIDLVTETNKYISANPKSYKPLLLTRVMAYVHRMLKIFGVMGDDDYTLDAASAGSDKIAPVLDTMAKFRELVRSAAQKKKSPVEFLQMCDELRDNILPELGVRLEDKPDGTSVWKLGNAAELVRQREEKKAQAKANAIKKLTSTIAERKKDLDKWNGAKLSAKEWMAQQVASYKAFDATTGLPTQDQKGEPISKSGLKAAEKSFKKQDDLHKQLTEKMAKDAEFLNKLVAELRDLESQLKKLSSE